jgi:thiosulfate dehydrogenase [quinone] large subunit
VRGRSPAIQIDDAPTAESLWGVLRLFMAWIFMWQFLDKVFGWGYSTESYSGWIDGGSSTAGYLEFGIKGPFVGLFQDFAGYAVVDWAFMFGLAGVGVALMLVIGVRIGRYRRDHAPAHVAGNFAA